jgi:hypothetical protein
VRDYLLNPEHPGNGGKARFFIGFGFMLDEAGTHLLLRALSDHPIHNTVVQFV